MEYENFYVDMVISPIDEYRSKLLDKIASKNIFDILKRSYYKKMLEKVDNDLLEEAKIDFW